MILLHCISGRAAQALPTRAMTMHSASWRNPSVVPRRRHYATVENLDDARLWDKPPSSDTASEQERPPSAASAVAPRTSKLDPKAQDVTEALHAHLRSIAPAKQQGLGRKINNAKRSRNPVAALKALSKREGLSKVNRASKPGPESQSDVPEPPISTVQVMDVQHVQRTTTLPKPEEYPGAPTELFEPKFVVVAISNACQHLKIPLQADVTYSMRQGLPASFMKRNPNGLHVCNLSVDLPGVGVETAQGEDHAKGGAKSSAWLQIAAKMHANGTLKDLFPESVRKGKTAALELASDVGPVLDAATLDPQVMANEKDAKTDVYNYAAGLGYVPEFEAGIRTVRARPRPGKRATGKVKPKAVVQVTIKLAELQIEVAAAGTNLATAEIAAALAFKRKAEEQHTSLGEQAPQAQEEFSLLTVETAAHFFNFYKETQGRAYIEIEYEQTDMIGQSHTRAQFKINDELIGKPVTMKTKKEAETISYLTAAVALTRTQPDLLTAFAERMKRGKGKVLRTMPPVDLQVDIGTLQVMRDALVEARQAGLPDSRETLLAAEDRTAMNTSRGRLRTILTSEEVKRASLALEARLDAFESDEILKDLRAKKASLPMNQYRDKVLSMVSDNLYSIVVGATGSGKTTQVPQIILDAEIRKGTGGNCNIICTQPRRIAATSVAQRVAAERDERLQQSIGYHVRFEPRLPETGGSVTYCTTGILLEQLKHDPEGIMNSVSHIIIDEVHERDMNIDFLMIVLKKAIKARQLANKSIPKVVLMSATLDTNLFSNYFTQPVAGGVVQPAPCVSVPGRTFPVKEKYLGDIMHDMLGTRRAEWNALSKLDRASIDYLKSETAFSASNSKSAGESPIDSVIDWKRQTALASEEETTAAEDKEEGLVPTALAAATIAQICESSEDGAILAFFPGLEEIRQTQQILLGQTIFGQNFSDTTKYKIFLLHSSVPAAQQSEVFQPLPPGCRKIVLSTNIAETSVTVADVKYVVDTGKLRETRYDQLRRITALKCVWESKSNSKQRAGRAGRVQDGFYYALFSQERHQSMGVIGLPELLRSDLQETCLSIKAQGYDESVGSFLAQAIEPPPKSAVTAAVSNLAAIEAFTEDEKLTDLGRLLSKLPVHPTLAKMIILGIIFRCLDPMLVLGAASAERSLFVNPIGSEMRGVAKRARQSYAHGEASDHLAIYGAFREMRTLRDQYGLGAAMDRARDNMVHLGAFKSIDQTARQIVDVLTEARILPRVDYISSSSEHHGPSDLNINSDNTALLKCLLLAGQHPNVAAKTNQKGMT